MTKNIIVLKKPKTKGLKTENGILYNKKYDGFYSYFNQPFEMEEIKKDKSLRKKYKTRIYQI
jgi:hypothetical protein